MIEARLLHPPVQEVSPDPEAQDGRFRIHVTESNLTHFHKSPFYQGVLEDGREVTLKFSKVDEGVRREYDGLRLAHAHGVRVPKAYGVVERDEDPPVSVMMETIQGYSLGKIPQTKGEHMVGLGAELANLHSIQVSGFGYYTDGQPQFGRADQHINRLTTDASNYFYGHTEGLDLLHDLSAQMTARPGHVEPVATHGDVNDSNIMLEREKNIVLIDFEFWKGAEGMEDIGMYNYYLVKDQRPEKHFNDLIDGYTDGQGLTADQQLPLMYYTLVYAARTIKFVTKKQPNVLPVQNIEDLKRVTEHVKNMAA
jgi:aminoglycoside phosphotransferase (APT) family kinase protein